VEGKFCFSTCSCFCLNIPVRILTSFQLHYCQEPDSGLWPSAGKQIYHFSPTQGTRFDTVAHCRELDLVLQSQELDLSLWSTTGHYIWHCGPLQGTIFGIVVHYRALYSIWRRGSVQRTRFGTSTQYRPNTEN
jgi:hypothetical protein